MGIAYIALLCGSVCALFVRMCCGAHDSVDLSVSACVDHFMYQSINQSINQRSIRVTKVTNVTARPLLQC